MTAPSVLPAPPGGQPGFSVTGIDLPGSPAGLFGVWAVRSSASRTAGRSGKAASAAQPDGPAMTTAAAGAPSGPLWQIVLPADPAAARSLLDRQQALVEQQRDALVYAKGILNDAARRQKLHAQQEVTGPLAGSRPANGPSFPSSIPPGPAGLAAMVAWPVISAAPKPALPPPVSPAEVALLQKLNAPSGGAASGTAAAPAPVFGLDIQMPWDQALQFARQWQSFVNDVINLVAHYAEVETDLTPADGGSAAPGPQPIGRTIVDWDGNFHTAWAPGLSGAQMELHTRSLHLALASRLALIHLVGTVASSAVTLVLASPTVVAFTLALPAVFQAVKDAIDEYMALQKPNPE